MGRIVVTARRYARTSCESCVKFVAKIAIIMVALLLKSYWAHGESKQWKPKRPVRRRPF